MLRRQPFYRIPSPAELASIHPQFALAMLEGCAAHPNERIMEADFSTNAVGVFEDASFDSQITSYSIFLGADYTIDPQPSFAGNPLKGLSDVTSELVSGVVCTLSIRGRGDDYQPIPLGSDVPLQLVPGILNGSAGTWYMDNPDTGRARFTVRAPTIAAPFSVWLVFAFLVLQGDCEPYLCLSKAEARKRLRECHGIGCACPAPAATGSPGAGG